jgi:hypothetical protein
VYVTLLVGGLGILALLKGYSAAATQQDYLVDKEGLVVVRVYGDTVLLVSTDRNDHRITKQLKVHKITDSRPLDVAWEKVGKLSGR